MFIYKITEVKILRDVAHIFPRKFQISIINVSLANGLSYNLAQLPVFPRFSCDQKNFSNKTRN